MLSEFYTPLSDGDERLLEQMYYLFFNLGQVPQSTSIDVPDSGSATLFTGCWLKAV